MPEAAKQPDVRISNFSFDVEADRKVEQQLAHEMLPNIAHIDPLMAEGALRDEDWARQARIETERVEPEALVTEDGKLAHAQPAAAPEPPKPDRLTQLEAALAEKQAALEASNKELGRLQNKFGDERKQVAERLARLETAARGASAQQNAATGYMPAYDPRILGDADPNVPLTAGQTAMLLQSMAAAFGSQLSAREQQILDAAKTMQGYDLTSNEEADLIERHGWLASLDRASQIRAMRDLVKPLRDSNKPAAEAPLKPQGVNLAELARAKHLTATTFIEPSSTGSRQETQAATGVDSGLAKKIAEYRELMSKPYGTPGISEQAEKLLKEINALQRRRS